MSNPNMPSQPENSGTQGPEFVMPQDFTVPELPAVGTPDKVLDGARETGSYTTPDGVTNVREVTADGMKQTRVSGMGSQHNLPKTAADLFAERQAMNDAVEAAAVREPAPAQNEALRQMGIAAADRKNRDAAGLPPRTHDLR